jgi:hypothetical protein
MNPPSRSVLTCIRARKTVAFADHQMRGVEYNLKDQSTSYRQEPFDQTSGK